MAYVMKRDEFVSRCRGAALDYKTLYVKGCFGAPMTEANKARYSANNSYNEGRADIINAASADTFGFDCVCFVKGILWGWCGDESAAYGGAVYASGGVPDIGTESMIEACSDVSEDFSSIEEGELLWMSGHVGVYLGGGLAAECTPSWSGGVQITAVGNIGEVSGYRSRCWTRHGRLPYVDYAEEASADFTSDGGTSKGCASEWAEEATEAAKAAGVFVGDETGDYNWQGALTREAAAVVLHRLGLF